MCDTWQQFFKKSTQVAGLIGLIWTGLMCMQVQAKEIADDINANGVEVSPDREVIALIAYLQRLGTDINKAEEVPVK